MRLSKTQLVAAAIGLAILAALVVAMRPKPLVIDAAKVVTGPLDATVDADGKTRVRERYVVVAPVTGRVDRIALVEGAAVRAGEVIARLRPPPLDSSALSQARARIEAADAIVVQAGAQSRAASADLAQRRRETSRAKRLAEVGGVAPRVVEECELAQLQAEEAARVATERTRAAEADAHQARAVLAGQAGEPNAVVLVRAPVNGRVLRIPERSERIVAAGTPLVEVGDPTSLEIVIDVLSSDGALVHPGDRVRLTEWTTNGGGDEGMTQLGGRVRDIEPAGYTKISALGVEEQRVNVIVDPDTIPAAVGDAFRVEASIVVWSAPSVTIVPRSALVQGTIDGASGWSAFVVRDGRIATRVVRIGHIGGANAEVVDGLRPGEQVVVFPSDQVKEGIRVTPREAP